MVTNYGERGGGLENASKVEVKFLPSRKGGGGVEKVLAMLMGGGGGVTTSFGVVFMQ